MNAPGPVLSHPVVVPDKHNMVTVLNRFGITVSGALPGVVTVPTPNSPLTEAAVSGKATNPQYFDQ